MANITVSGSRIGSQLTEMLMADDLVPGDTPSYQLCKTLYTHHPLGAKIAESPIAMAMCQQREITIPGAPEEVVRDAFNKEWEALHCNIAIKNTATLARVYGVAALTVGIVGIDPSTPMPTDKLVDAKIYFNVQDPLNTAGSFTNTQDPNSPEFQKFGDKITVMGIDYHPSRACVKLNEAPVYLDYTSSGFGWVGRSAYQRALFPLKSFIQSMITDDLVTRKAGLLIAKMKQPGSIINNIMGSVMGLKRALLKEAQNNDVLSIDITEDIHAVDLTNVDGAATTARKNVLENVAASAGMPALLLNNETFAEGFGEGTEDAKKVARYIDGVREELNPLYRFLDPIVMRRAWTPAFYKTVQEQFPDQYKGVSFNAAYYQWCNAFSASWPSLLTEPDSEKVEVEAKKLKGITDLLEKLGPQLDPENKGILIEWAASNINEHKLMFPTPLILDIETLTEFLEDQVEQQKQLAEQGQGEPGNEPNPAAAKESKLAA